EDGIRYWSVTGVQTCALPICLQRNREVSLPSQHALLESTGRLDNFRRVAGSSDAPYTGLFFNDSDIYKWLEAAAWAQVAGPVPEIGRASCRESVESCAGGG